ncbi:D-alanyl-D-alanine carboxypeptidase [Jeotgalibacillus sp. S-D1]|uniref:D-alanyl-D-alanine carboxypeptidase family protein n=1 Tax=Jeotgalibacillus sp. S-D1 TaxID=2552189 RepID=UPI001059C0A9|nr:D-alanyl-D-alanine carboxypeptidase family protein [Jeotgalibacillus sp. S-D1]TDL34682.1 D-alanyl-D-alanine carboxypeptidase [Jeotgalibacillus sp. S-D1]
MKKWMLSIISVVFAFSILPYTTLANDQAPVPLDEVKSAILIDQQTGMLVLDKNSHESLPPASMTKIATMLLIMEAIDQKKISWEDKIKTSEQAASMGGSQIFLKAGEEMTVRDMLKGIAVASANDASVAMAEHLAGSEEEFVKKMNEKVKALGLKDTVFRNATGLPADGHVSSAFDMAQLAKELIKHEEITEFTGTYEDYLREDSEDPFWLVNTNKLVRFYQGADGLKTGFTKDAMYCLTATAQKKDMRFIAVVFGAPTSKARNEIASSMLDYGFTHYESKTLAKEGDQVLEVRIEKGSPFIIEGVLSEPLKWIAPVDGKEQNVKKSLHVTKIIDAPVKKGQKIGSMSLVIDGKEMSSVDVIAKRESKKASWGELFVRSAKEMVQ